MKTNFTEGQGLYWVPVERRQGAPGPVTITTVGRTWLTLSNGYRIDRETLQADTKGYSSPGRCYLTQEEYEAKRALERAWDRLSREVRNAGFHDAPRHLTAQDLERIRVELFLK